MNLKTKCACCGNEVDKFDICDTCGWQNSGPDETENNLKGSNKMSLEEAKEAYKNGEEIV